MDLTGDQIASLTYLALFGVVIGGWLLVSNRKNLGRMAQQAAIWVFLFLGAIVAVGLWTDVRDTVLPRQSVMQDGAEVVIPMGPDGHYYLTLDLNGVPVRFVVDTGASEIVLSAADAARIGIDPDSMVFSGRAYTANGMVQTAPVRIERIALGPMVDESVRAVVNQGDLEESLLGMSYLRRFERLEITRGQMVLER